MTTIQTFIKRRPVLLYFVLTFALSWGGILVVIGGPGAIPSPSAQAMRLLPVAILVMLVGPSVAGILLTGLVAGRAGLRELFSRLLKWRVGARWYAVALLTTPLLATAILWALSRTSPLFLPAIVMTDDQAGLLLTGIGIGLVVGFLEELGWTGFAIPRLRRRYGVLTTGLIVGLLWAVWHFLVYFWGSGDAAGAFSLALFLPEFLFLVGVLPVYRVLMVWVYDRTGSLLVAMLMHAIHTACTTAILVPLATGAPRILYYLILAALLWIVVAAVAVANRRQSAAKSPDEKGGDPETTLRTNPRNRGRQPAWQRITLLSILGYEGIGALLGGSLLAAAPDGRLMDMPVAIMHGVFDDFLIPGFILIGLGALNVIAFIAVLRRARTDWLLAGLALGGLAIWFIVEIAILQQLHWLHAMWGLPVLVGGLVALPLIPSHTMTMSKAFIQRHAVLIFFVLAFAISWSGILLLIGGPGAIPGAGEQVERLSLFVMLAWLAGPSVAGVLLTALVDGRAGLRALRSRLLKWRVGVRWYMVALLTAPLLYLAVLLPLSLLSPAFLPGILTTSDKASRLVMGIAYGLIGGGFLEELGWSGFAVPKLRLRYSAVTTALLVGALWGAYHFSVVFWMSGGNIGGIPLALFLTVRAIDLLVGGLPAYRVLMVWVYERTGGSLLVAMLMHASLTASMLILGPLALAGGPFLTYLLVSSAALWLVVAVALRWQTRSQQQPAGPMARPGLGAP